MGHNFKDSTVQEGIKLRSLKISKATRVLVVMKETAENYPGKKVGHPLVTVSAYFNDVQQQSTKNAGVVAAFNVLRIIGDSISTGVAYGLHKRTDKSTLVMISLMALSVCYC